MLQKYLMLNLDTVQKLNESFSEVSVFSSPVTRYVLILKITIMGNGVLT